MKVLYFVDGLFRGGKERRLMELMKHITKNKLMEVEIALMSENVQYDEVFKLGINVHYLIRRSKKDPRILLNLFKLCSTIKPDIIHTWDSMTSMYTAPIAKILGIKFINGMITDSSFKNNIFERGWLRSKITFPFSDVIVANSLAGLKAYKAPARKSVCIYNGFDPKRIENMVEPQIIIKKFDIRTPKVIGMVASFTERKDYTTFIRTAHEILMQRDDITFLAIGDGPLLEKCKSMIEENYKERIKFLGMQSDVESIINIFDVGVLTTNVDVHNEGISNSILEYMALGKPVVATNSGGTNEIVIDGKTGFVVSPKDIDDLKNKILKLIEDTKLAVEMGNAGKHRVAEIFTLDKMVSSYVELYHKCLNKQGK